MTKINKKAKVFEAPAEPAPPGKEAEAPVDIELNEEEGTAIFELVNGYRIKIKEPKAKVFLHYSSRLQTAPEYLRSAAMSTFWLTHLMIDSVRDGSGKLVENPSFEDFENWLEDDDIRRVSAALSCFPTVGSRMGRILNSLRPQRQSVQR